MTSVRRIIVLAVFAAAVGMIAGCGSNSSSTPPPPPTAPTNLAASAGNGVVGLTWTAVSGAASYDVYRGTATGALSTKTTVTTGIAGTSYDDATAANGTTYYYEVTAVNAGGESGGSNEATATPQANLPPAVPTGFTATAGDDMVALSWNAVPGATGYNVYRGTATGTLSSKATVTTGITAVNYNDTNVVDGTPYYYQVTAVNANGESSGSSEQNATPTEPLTLAMVTTSCTACHGLTVNNTVLLASSHSYTVTGRSAADWLTCVDTMVGIGAQLATGKTDQQYADFLAALP